MLYKFDGDSDYLDIPYDDSWDIFDNDNWTITFWTEI